MSMSKLQNHFCYLCGALERKEQKAAHSYSSNSTTGKESSRDKKNGGYSKGNNVFSSSSFDSGYGVMLVSITAVCLIVNNKDIIVKEICGYCICCGLIAVICTVAEFIWFLGVQAVSERSHSGHSSREGLLGGHGYWKWQVLMVSVAVSSTIWVCLFLFISY